MTLKLIMATGLVTLALLAGCNKAEEASEVKSATTEQTPAPAPAAESAPVTESTPATEAAPATATATATATEVAPAAK